ncbi:hypothetical protein D5S18_09735 [Nocardia panacis]|uniref:SH3 domain-containing protein n=1 Tax=Nocardia panacis TaxID=2340916 RepID=A0A3A4KPR1_9NOCA|nr:hypothetical protein [Nocardia panacis]RJO76562.1 hypothetical protein D5S18_09735 [Nocardia panacis]
MSKKVLTLATLAVGAALTAPGLAHAEPADTTKFSDRTAEFVNFSDPAAINAQAQGKQLIVSPYGTRNTIACRGDGAAVPLYDCMQEDAFGWITLNKQDTPLGTAWVHIV